MDYLSKGTGITLGTLGTVGFGITAAQLLNNGFGGNGFGLFGGNRAQELDALRAENALLKAENYSDAAVTKTYQQSLSDNTALRNEMFSYVRPIANEVAENRTRVAVLETQLQSEKEKACLREQIMEGKIAQVAQTAQCGISNLQGALSCLQNTVNSITKTVVPNSSICPGWGNVTLTPATSITPAA